MGEIFISLELPQDIIIFNQCFSGPSIYFSNLERMKNRVSIIGPFIIETKDTDNQYLTFVGRCVLARLWPGVHVHYKIVHDNNRRQDLESCPNHQTDILNYFCSSIWYSCSSPSVQTQQRLNNHGGVLFYSNIRWFFIGIINYQNVFFIDCKLGTINILYKILW